MDRKDKGATNNVTPDPSSSEVVPRRGRSGKGKDTVNNATLAPPPSIMPQTGRGRGKGKGKGKDADGNTTSSQNTKSSRPLPPRPGIPRLDDVTKHLGSTIDSEEFSTLVVAAGSYEAALVLLGRCLNVNIESIKDLFKDQLASFSKARYSNIAHLFHMSAIFNRDEWKTFEIPRVSLPNRVKEVLLNAGVRAYQQSGALSLHANEHVRVRFLGAWLSILISLFDGCVYDIPENPMPGTHASTGGKVEYELFMWERTVVLVIEVKHQLGKGEALWNQLAQVMCELDSACHMNRRISLQDFPIYAILTDGEEWHFLAYNGAQEQFYMDEPVKIDCPSFKEDNVLYIRSMIAVCNRIFGVLLQGYINTLEAYEDKSNRRGMMGDESKHPSSSNLPIPIPDSERGPVQRGSTKTWESKVTDITKCRKFFESFSGGNRIQGDAYAKTGCQMLEDCVQNIEVHGRVDVSEVRKVVKCWKDQGDHLIDV